MLKNNFYLLLAIAICLSSHTNAQYRYSHGVGIELNTLLGKHQGISVYAAYHPKLYLWQLGESFSVSAGSHVGLGYHSARTLTSKFSGFGFSVPLVLQLNFGKFNETALGEIRGFYIEGGYSLFSLGSNLATGPTVGIGYFSGNGIIPANFMAYYTYPIGYGQTSCWN
jgi:hypothetical protein